MRCAIYARFSSDMQSRHSADDQIRECLTFAERMGWAVALTERDEAVRAGAVANRDGYARLLASAKAGNFDVLLVEEVSRFSRDFLGGMTELGMLAKLKVRVADTRNGIIDLDSAQGQMMGAVSLMMAHQETKKLGERSKRGIKGKVLKGFSGGGLPAYGYRRVPVFSETETDVDGRPKRSGVRLEPDPATALVVVRIFKLYDEGCAKSEIAKKLNEEHIESRDAGRVRKGRVNSGTWTAASVKKLLGNEVYVGERIWNKNSRVGDKLPGSGKNAMRPNPESEWIHIDDYAPPIVDRELWHRVQQRLAVDRAAYDRDHTGKVNRRYLLSGFLTCSACSGSYTIGSHLRGQRQYRCSMRATRGKVVCSNRVCVPQAALEARVKLILDAMSKDPDKLRELVAEHNERITEVNAEQNSAIARLEVKLGNVAASAARLVDAIAAGEGESARLATKLAAVEAEEVELKQFVEQARSQIQPYLIPRPLAVADFLSGAASVFTGDYIRDRAFLETVVEKIVVHPSGTVVLHFRQDTLFAPLVTYEVRSGSAPPTENEIVAAAPEEEGDGPSFTRIVVARDGLVARTAGNAATRTAIDFGGGVVAFYEHPRRNTVGVPSGI